MDLSDPSHAGVRECLLGGVLCNEARLVEGEGNRHGIKGDPTEAAMLVAAAKAGLIHADLQANYPRLDMIPFASEHMFRATLHRVGDCDRRVIYKVGAVERLLDHCDDMLDEQGQVVQLDREQVRFQVEQLASRGLRVQGVARRLPEEVQDTLDHAHVAQEMTFVGLHGMIDPPRQETVEAIRICRGTGIAVKMITGDHLATAQAVARQIGLIPDASPTRH